MSVGDLLNRGRQLHEDERLIRLATTTGGRLLVWLLATLLLLPEREVVLVSPLLFVLLWLPEAEGGKGVPARNLVLCLGSVAYLAAELIERGIRDPAMVAVDVAILGLVCLGVYRAARAFARWPQLLRKYPQVALHFCLLTLLALAFPLWQSSAVADSAWWPNVHAVFAMLLFLVWRFGYLLLTGKRGRLAQSRFSDHLFYFFPAWGGTITPYGKGHDYLRNRGAGSAPEIAAARLAGLKLLLLAWLWRGARELIAALVYAETGAGQLLSDLPGLGLPRLATLLVAQESAPVGVAWASLLVEFVDSVLKLAITGHLIIGTLRLFGYNVFRNTYKPLLAELIVDFWNRFYYYFKELLVEFFFFPTYVALSRRRQRLRIFAAVMAAACAGNLYFHALADLEHFAAAGPTRAAAMLAPRAVYTLLLALGLSVSMIREQQRRGGPTAVASPLGAGLLRIRRIGGVWLFYATLHVFNVSAIRIPLAERLAFLQSLIGLGS